MASCIIPPFSALPTMSSDARCHNWLYPERFGLGEPAVPGLPDHPLPCKIEPDTLATLSISKPSSDRKHAKRSHSELLDAPAESTEPCIRSVPESTPCSSPSKLPEPDHEVHIWTERERRKKMRSMFVTLHSMLPKVPSKADKSTIVDEAISYIKSLEQKMQRLVRRKADKAKLENKVLDSAQDIQSTQQAQRIETSNNTFRSLSSSNIVFNICGSDAFITICANGNRPNLLSRIFTCVIHTHRMDVKNVQITDTSDNRRLLMIHACATDVTRTSEPDLRNVMQELMRCI